MPTYGCSFKQIDVCGADNLTDHHNRPGESLFSVSLDADLTFKELISGFTSTIEGHEGIPTSLSSTKIRKAIEHEYTGFDPAATVAEAYGIQVTSETEGSELSVWGLLTWKVQASPKEVAIKIPEVMSDTAATGGGLLHA